MHAAAALHTVVLLRTTTYACCCWQHYTTLCYVRACTLRMPYLPLSTSFDMLMQCTAPVEVVVLLHACMQRYTWLRMWTLGERGRPHRASTCLCRPSTCFACQVERFRVPLVCLPPAEGKRSAFLFFPRSAVGACPLWGPCKARAPSPCFARASPRPSGLASPLWSPPGGGASGGSRHLVLRHKLVNARARACWARRALEPQKKGLAQPTKGPPK